ncbi:MAG TPA: type II secretion system minor pseudopilin GspK [Rhodanobacter sp.]
MKRPVAGAALIMAMAVAAMAAMAATAIIAALGTWTRQAALSGDRYQAQELVGAGTDLARAVLFDDLRATGRIDHLGEPWALRLPPMPVEGGELVGRIDDQQGLFNLNNLVVGGKLDVVQYARLQRLLSILGLSPGLAGGLVDWIDADHQPQPDGGAEDDYYLTLTPAYRAANQPLVDLDELALVRGFDTAVRARLTPFVTALPAPSALNVNTAPPEVLAAVVDGLSLDSARSLALQRASAPFRDSADFREQLAAVADVPARDIRVDSSYFVVVMRVNYGDAQARGRALLRRADADSWPDIVWRRYR